MIAGGMACDMNNGGRVDRINLSCIVMREIYGNERQTYQVVYDIKAIVGAHPRRFGREVQPFNRRLKLEGCSADGQTQ